MNTNRNRFFAIGWMILFARLTSFSQGIFVNLNFESPILPLTRDQFFQVPITNALPGWTGYIGGNQVNRIGYNTFALSAAAISLQDTGSPYFTPLQGSYSVFLQSGQGGDAAIGQVGQVSSTIHSLFFLAQFDNIFPGPLVTFAGQSISYFELSRSNNYSTFAADISTLAGQTGELRFASRASTLLDGIRLSTTIVPEPNIYSLLGCGLLLLGAARATLKRKQ